MFTVHPDLLFMSSFFTLETLVLLKLILVERMRAPPQKEFPDGSAGKGSGVVIALALVTAVVLVPSVAPGSST